MEGVFGNKVSNRWIDLTKKKIRNPFHGLPHVRTHAPFLPCFFFLLQLKGIYCTFIYGKRISACSILMSHTQIVLHGFYKQISEV